MIFKSPYQDVEIPRVSLPEFVLESARQRGDKPALIDGPSGRTITYQRDGSSQDVEIELTTRPDQ